jgi:hypothetical protein
VRLYRHDCALHQQELDRRWVHTTDAVATLPAGTEISAVIYPPQAAIPGAGAARRVGDQQLVALNLTRDHHILNGAEGARFLQDVKAILESPLRLGAVSDIAERVRAATPLVEQVVVETIGDRAIASVHLNAAILRRTEQQGPADSSIAAAANAARIQRLLASAIAGTDARCRIAVLNVDTVVAE